MTQKKQGTNVIVPLKIEWNHRALTLSPNTLHYVFVENGYIYESTSISSSKHVHGEVKLSTSLVFLVFALFCDSLLCLSYD